MQESGSAKGLVVLLTGLSGAGKSTLATAIERQLELLGFDTEILDGDEIRKQYSVPLAFTPEAREENLRRLGAMAKEHAESGKIVLIAAIAPFRAGRDALRIQFRNYLEVFVDAPLALCEQRDPKGLYRRARAKEIVEFTGIDSPFETPVKPDIWCRTADPLKVCVEQLLEGIVKILHVSIEQTQEGLSPDHLIH